MGGTGALRQQQPAPPLPPTLSLGSRDVAPQFQPIVLSKLLPLLLYCAERHLDPLTSGFALLPPCLPCLLTQRSTDRRRTPQDKAMEAAAHTDFCIGKIRDAEYAEQMVVIKVSARACS